MGQDRVQRIMKKSRLRDFYILWSTQALSQLGSSMTSFALTLWLYDSTGSSLSTAALTICSYMPYVLMSVFAGALSDRFDKKKTMLVCDSLAALSTVIVLSLYRTGNLAIRHLYLINALSGLMNTVQEPASEVAVTLLVPNDLYQKSGSLKQLSRSLISIFNPLISTALYGLFGLEFVMYFDLLTFVIAFLALFAFISLPKVESERSESVMKLVKEGIKYLKENPLIFRMIVFMSGVNLVASAFDAVLPGLVIPSPKGGDYVLGIVTSCSGIAMVIGSLIASIMPKPKDRIRMIYLTMLFSLGTENFLLAFSREPIVWCIGQLLGWAVVPIMSTNYEIVFKNTVPVKLQGRVYACRNSLQFFTIPLGLFMGGFMVDEICEPIMGRKYSNIMNDLFGYGKGSGAALAMFILGILGIVLCLVMGRLLRDYRYDEN